MFAIFKSPQLTRHQEENLAKTLLDMGKICFATLIIGPAVSGLNAWLVTVGVVSFVVLVGVGLHIDKGERE
jgi:hypothetical protein